VNRFSVDGSSWPFIYRLSTIYLSTVSPGPLTVVAQPLSPGASQPYRVSETRGHLGEYISFWSKSFLWNPCMTYVTLVLPFNAGSDTTKRLLSYEGLHIKSSK